jgi:hypothetical protein
VEIEYKLLKLWTFYETAKFTWDQSDWLGKLEWGDFKQANQRRILYRTGHKFSDCRKGRTCDCIALNLGRTYRINYTTRK